MASSRFNFSQWELALPQGTPKSSSSAMNWSEGNLYRSKRGKLRKANPARQRQKEYFAQARLRASQREETTQSPRPSWSLEDAAASSNVRPNPGRPSPKSHLFQTPEEFMAEQAAIARGEVAAQEVPRVSREDLERLLQKVQVLAERHQSHPSPPLYARASPLQRSAESPGKSGTSIVAHDRLLQKEQRRKRKEEDRRRKLHRRDPVPLRRVSSHIYSLGGFDSSVEAQVGQPVVPVPESQQAENNLWRTWPGFSVSGHTLDITKNSEDIGLTPGVNTDQVRCLEQRQKNTSSSSDYSRILNRYEALLSKLREGVPPESSTYRIPEEPAQCHDTGPPDNAPEVFAEDVPVSEALPPKPDNDEAWKMFVFGDGGTDDIAQEVFDEARHDAARTLQPSEDLFGDYDTGMTADMDSVIPAVGTECVPEASDFGLSTASTSLEATLGSSAEPPGITPSAPSTDPQPTSLDVEPQSQFSDFDFSGIEFDNMIRSDANDPSLPPTSDVGLSMDSMVVEVPSVTTASQPQFKFARPKPFVGRMPTQPQVNPVRLTRNKGRPKKRALDGRADIRALPNYNEDPIEEVEEDVEPNAPKGLFGPLEVA
ncbi:hypothetical protein QBC47DRAFT_456258 [Echria macrotheca]|uniref:Uncharacterized protein n=1 Tax=Echria macrotheca TaxID=438768 RepID=A0AAJ0BLJ6_9PEZI|nr:hypothetical protein QBC47DRAFT_456258 [Echria macrotheca]